MRGETGTLVGLEHAIAKRVLFRHLEIGNLRGIHKLELWCGRRAGRRCQIARDGDQVGPIHFATVIHVEEARVVVSGSAVTWCGRQDGIFSECRRR